MSYAVVDQDVRSALAGLGAQLGMHVNISAAVQGRVHGKLPAGTGRQTLERLASLYGFDWYCDGDVLWISAADEASSKVLATAPVGAAAFATVLQDLDVADPRWPVRVTGDGGIALVEGPPHYVALVDQTLSLLTHRVQAGDTEVRVFRGSAAPGR